MLCIALFFLQEVMALMLLCRGLERRRLFAIAQKKERLCSTR